MTKNYIIYDINTGMINSIYMYHPNRVLGLSSNEKVLVSEQPVTLNNYIDLNTLDILDKGTPPSSTSIFNYTTNSWQELVDPNKKKLSDLRYKRNSLLQGSDWTDTLSAKTRLGDQLYEDWQTYRQALRDITNQPGYPDNVVWPTPPQ